MNNSIGLRPETKMTGTVLTISLQASILISLSVRCSVQADKIFFFHSIYFNDFFL